MRSWGCARSGTLMIYRKGAQGGDDGFGRWRRWRVITNKRQRRQLADRMKDVTDPLQLVIVCDMWLTGLTCRSCTMYIDKPMKGHNLMQAIARVNRVYKDKRGGDRRLSGYCV